MLHYWSQKLDTKWCPTDFSWANFLRLLPTFPTNFLREKKSVILSGFTWLWLRAMPQGVGRCITPWNKCFWSLDFRKNLPHMNNDEDVNNYFYVWAPLPNKIGMAETLLKGWRHQGAQVTAGPPGDRWIIPTDPPPMQRKKKMKLEFRFHFWFQSSRLFSCLFWKIPLFSVSCNVKIPAFFVFLYFACILYTLRLVMLLTWCMATNYPYYVLCIV